jgi:hypothetical protein
MDDLEDLETRLREFRPRRPAAIPDERLQLLRGPIWVIVAAALAAAMLIAVRLHAPSTSSQREVAVTPVSGGTVTTVTVGALTIIAAEHPDELDRVLTQLSRTTLPDVAQPGGVLRGLAKEF